MHSDMSAALRQTSMEAGALNPTTYYSTWELFWDSHAWFKTCLLGFLITSLLMIHDIMGCISGDSQTWIRGRTSWLVFRLVFARHITLLQLTQD